MEDDRLDEYLRHVSDRHRRRIVQRLRDEPDGEATVEDLVDRLHPGEATAVDDPVPDRGRFASLLTHSHLPMLADFGVVELDRENGTVRYLPDEQLEAVLDSLPGGAVETKP